MVSYEELKYVGFVQLIELKALVLLSNIYDFFKDNSLCLKSAVVSVESKVISPMRLINEKLTMLCDYKLGFIDDKFDKYAPTFIKNLVGRLNSSIKENIYFVEEFFGPLVHKARTLLEKGLSTIESLLQKCIDAKKSVFKHLVYRTESFLEKGLYYAKQVLDKTKIVVGGIPIIGDATQSIITIHIDMAIQWIETTTSSIKEYGISGAITSTVKNVVKETQETSVSIIQKGTESATQVLETTKYVVGGIPIIGDAAQSIITKQTDMASQLIDNATSSIKENGIFGAITSATKNVISEAQETSASIIQKSTESASQALETSKSIIGSIPIIGDAAQSIITKPTDMAKQFIITTTVSVNENGIVGAITSATKNVLSEAQATGASIIQKGTDSASQALDTTKSVVGGIPIIGDAAQSIITKQTDMASQLIDTTTSSVKENGIFGAITSAAKNVVSEAQSTGASIIQKGTESASQALDTTKSVVSGIPIIGDAAQSIITKQTDMVSDVVQKSTSSVKTHGLLGAIISTVEQVVEDAGNTTKTIIEKGSESVNQTLEKTTSTVGDIPILGNLAGSILGINKNTKK